jgi:hypothetical protein
MGDIKTKKRNRLGVQKLRDCAFVKGELRRLHAEEGTTRIRLKRKFGNAHATVVDTDRSGSRVEDEDIVQAAERHAAEGASESDGDLDGDREDLLSRHIGLVESIGGSQRSFAALSRQFATAVDSDDGDDSDGDDELPTGVQQSVASRVIPRVR